MGYEIYVTEGFLEAYSKFDIGERIFLDKIKINLSENPTGKIIRFSWFREKKFGDKRLYYLIDEDLKKVLIVGYSSKKDQKRAIKCILQNMNTLLSKLKELKKD